MKNKYKINSRPPEKRKSLRRFSKNAVRGAFASQTAFFVPIYCVRLLF